MAINQNFQVYVWTQVEVKNIMYIWKPKISRIFEHNLDGY